MILRAGLTSVILVALLALALAMKVTGSLSSKDFDQFADVARGLHERVSAAGVNIDRVVAAEPPKATPGRTCVLLLAQGTVLGLDRQGLVTFCDTTCTSCDLPALTGLPINIKAVNGRVSSPEMTLAFAILDAFERKPDVYNMLSEIGLEQLEEPKAILCGGVIVELGQGGYVGKVERLSKVLAQLAKLEMAPATIDLRFGRQVPVKCIEHHHGSRKEV